MSSKDTSFLEIGRWYVIRESAQTVLGRHDGYTEDGRTRGGQHIRSRELVVRQNVLYGCGGSGKHFG